MAALRKTARKTNVFWTKEPDDQDEKIVKLCMPGVILEPNANVKAPMVRKPVHMIKPRVVTLQKSLHNSLEKRKDLMEMHPKTSLVRNFTDSVPLTGHEGSFGHRHGKELERSKKQLSLKELNPQDKKRVANLVKELAKVGEERVHAEKRLQEERTAFEERLAILQEEYDAVIKEKHYLQKRFLELQALLVKYQTNGKTPSPQKSMKSPLNEEKEKHQVPGTLPSTSPSKPFTSTKPALTETPGNTRPGTSGPATGFSSGKLSEQTSGLPQHITPQVRNGSVPVNNSGLVGKTNAETSPFHNSSISSSHARESLLGKLNLSQNEQITAGTSTATSVPVTAPSKVQEIPQSSDLQQGIPLTSMNPREESFNTTTAINAHQHDPSANNTQPPIHTVPAGMSQHPPQAKPVFSVFGDNFSEPRADWRIPPRKNEDRSFSEMSGVSGSFSAELDAVYRLYCREYELQLQLQQQQIELQKQQFQLQQQLQQVEALQQQQQQQQPQQQQQQQQQQQHQQQLAPLSSPQQQEKPTGQSSNYIASAHQTMTRAPHKQHLTTVVEETPAPSPVPRPSSHPRQASPARSLIPTPEGSSSVVASGRLLPSVDLQTSRTGSASETFVSRDPVGTEVSGSIPLGSGNKRTEFEKENTDPLLPLPLDRAISAPPSLGHSRSNFEHQMPRHRDEFRAPVDRSNCGSVVSGYGRYSMDEKLQTNAQQVGGRASTDYLGSGLSNSSYSLYSESRDVSGISHNAALKERREQDVYAEPAVINGRTKNNSFYPTSNYQGKSERGSIYIAQRFHTDSFLNGTRRTNQPAIPERHVSHSQLQSSLNRRTAGSDQRFSLSDVAQSRGNMLPDDDIMAFREHRLETGRDRAPVERAYPISLVDIVDGLENGTEKHEAPGTNPGLAGELDTTDSGYSQDTYKERSPLTSDNVNTDEEEAAVLGDIFFLTGRV